MKFVAIVLVLVFLKVRLCSSSDQENSEPRTFGGLSRPDRTSTSTTTSTTARSVISENKILDEPKEIPISPHQHDKSQPPNQQKPKEESRSTIEERTFGRDGLKNIMLGGVAVAVINIAPVILSGLKTVVNLALPILGLLLFRKHNSFRYFDDFMDILEQYTNEDEDQGDIVPEEVVVKNNEYYPEPNYPYANYDYNYYNTNPYRAYSY